MRVAIIGLGSAGAGLHLPALAGLPSIAVVGGCDLDARCRERVAVRWKIPIFSEPGEMLAQTDADVVIVATPPATHADYCLRALAAGRHVICEKPFVASLDEADRVIAAAAAAKRQVAVNHEFREMPIRALIDQVAGGGAGALRFVQAWQLMDMAPWAEGGWRGQMAERTLFEAGVHLVDLIIALFGEKPESVQASMSRGVNQGSNSDAIVLATFLFSGNRLAQLTQNRLCKGESQYFEVRADAEHASFRASFGGRARLTAGLVRSKKPHLRFEYGSSGLAWREDGHRRKPLARNSPNPNMLATREVLKNALAAFKQNSPPRCSAMQARDVLEVVAGCYISAIAGERVRLGPGASRRLIDFRMGAPSSDTHSGPIA